jgi:hypothetical protein
MTDTVKQKVRDGASLAVGVGALGYQTARTRAEDAQTRVNTSVKDAKGTAEQGARRVWEQIEVIGNDVRELVEPVITRVSDRIEPLIGDLAARLEPVIDRIQTEAHALAQRVPGKGTKKVETEVKASA